MGTSPSFVNGGESLGLPPEIAKRKNGLMSALMAIPEDDPGMGRQNSGSMGAPPVPMNDGGTATPQTTPRVEDDKPSRAQPAQPQSLAEKMSAGNYDDMQMGQPQDDRMQRLQSESDELGKPTPRPSLKSQIFGGVLGAALPGYGQARLRQQGQQQDEKATRRNKILDAIEAERRMQEQEGLADKRMTLQEQMRQESEQGQADRQQPEHMDTDQGPIQWDRQSKSWTPIQVGGQRVGPKTQPKPDTPEQQFFDSPEEQGKTLKQKLGDYATATQRPERPGAESGTWSLQEDDDGNSVEFNSKTGATRPAPASGLHKPGTYQKTKGAAADAQAYGDMYLKSGKWSGPADEALLEKYFELAKPSSGFRMTQNQMDMLLGARSAVEGMKARGEHLVGGSYFSQEQRQQIVETMRMITDSKGGGLKDKVQNQAPEGHRITNGQQTLEKRNGKWVPVQ